MNELKKDELSYDVIAAESQRRSAKSIDDAIKVISCLVERNPGDLVIARDVAFSAMELERPAQAYPLLWKVAKARPYEPSVYPAIAQCLARLEQADMAMVFYEIALQAGFQNREEDYAKIVAAEYLYLVNQVVSGKLDSSVPTRIGGNITSDVTTGFGPEMYFVNDAPTGKYDIQVKLFNNGQSRVSLRNKVHLTIYKKFGDGDARVIRRTVLLKNVGNKESVSTVGIEK